MKKIIHKIKLISGLILLAKSLFLFFAFNSYWKNGISDQSEIIGNVNNYVNTQNTLGGLGAESSEFFIRILEFY